MVQKTNPGGASKGNFKMPVSVPNPGVVPGHGSKSSYPGHGSPLMQTYKSNAKTKPEPPYAAQQPDTAVGHGSKSSYPKKSLPSFGTETGGLQKPPAGTPKSL